jgi:phosphate transport system substrate-binding protein
MISKLIYGVVLAILSVGTVAAQSDLVAATKSKDIVDKQKIVVVTGARFSYKLVQQWIDDFNKQFPDIQIIIESRGSSDPLQYDILAEVYEHDQAVKNDRHYLYVARYAILPVATSASQFAKVYASRGITDNQLKQIFFHNIFANKEDDERIKAPFTSYTRFQKAGAPKVFAQYYGFEQKDIVGKAIAGSDEHLLRALLRDSTGITYLPLPLVYDAATGKRNEGLTIIPVDLDGNGKVKDDEVSVFASSETLLKKLEGAGKEKINVPTEYLHLSVGKSNASAEALAFLKWVAEHGESYLNAFGFLKPERTKLEAARFIEHTTKKELK